VLGIDAIERGANARDSRKLANAFGKDVYATPVKGGVCLSSADYTVAGCRPTAALPSGGGADALIGLEGTSCSPFLPVDKMVIAGLVSDGVDEVSLNRDQGKATTLAVEDNLLLAILDRADAPVVTISWTDTTTGKAHSVPSPLPADAVSDRCVPTDTAAEVDEARKMAAGGSR
jgi:hypothetical protein